MANPFGKQNKTTYGKQNKTTYGKQHKRYCSFCRDKVEYIDYKDVSKLKRYISDRGKIRPRRVSGNCAQHQQELSIAIKRAREMALIPYFVRK